MNKQNADIQHTDDSTPLILGSVVEQTEGDIFPVTESGTGTQNSAEP